MRLAFQQVLGSLWVSRLPPRCWPACDTWVGLSQAPSSRLKGVTVVSLAATALLACMNPQKAHPPLNSGPAPIEGKRHTLQGCDFFYIIFLLFHTVQVVQVFCVALPAAALLACMGPPPYDRSRELRPSPQSLASFKWPAGELALLGWY